MSLNDDKRDALRYRYWRMRWCGPDDQLFILELSGKETPDEIDMALDLAMDTDERKDGH